MERFVQTLVAVVEANQRFLLKRSLVQLSLLIASGFGLSRLAGGWWWLSLVLFVLSLLATVLGAFQLKLHLTMKLAPPWRAIGLGPPVSRSKERVLELHSFDGNVRWVPVRADLVEGLLTAAQEAGLEVVTEPEALKALSAGSAHLERSHELEALLPHVPTPALREELSAALGSVRQHQPEGAEQLLKELEILLLAEKNAQTTTSLRGPRPVFEKEIREKLSKLRELSDRGPRSST